MITDVEHIADLEFIYRSDPLFKINGETCKDLISRASDLKNKEIGEKSVLDLNLDSTPDIAFDLEKFSKWVDEELKKTKVPLFAKTF